MQLISDYLALVELKKISTVSELLERRKGEAFLACLSSLHYFMDRTYRQLCSGMDSDLCHIESRLEEMAMGETSSSRLLFNDRDGLREY